MGKFETLSKAEAIASLGGTVTAAAEAMGDTVSAVSKWPDPLPKRIAQRVHGVLALQRRKRTKPAPQQAAGAHLAEGR